MKLEGRIANRETLLSEDKERMFKLMAMYFDNMKRENFYRDLQEKKWVIILEDCLSHQIQGFSTQMFLEAEISGTPVKAVFSGDTIIDKKYWGERELVRVWGRLIVSLIEQYPGTKLYWFLISMGYRTYRFLPVYFYEFYPRYDLPTPKFEQEVIDFFAGQRYPAEYNADTGVIHFLQPREHLKENVADITEERLRDPHIKFFSQKNPFSSQGDELACLAELTEQNTKPIFKRIIKNSILNSLG